MTLIIPELISPVKIEQDLFISYGVGLRVDDLWSSIVPCLGEEAK